MQFIYYLHQRETYLNDNFIIVKQTLRQEKPRSSPKFPPAAAKKLPAS